MALETDKVASISTWSAESTPSLHATEHNALHTAYNAAVGGATIAVGAEASDVINVTIQLEDNEGDDLAVVGYVFAFLSSASTGIGIEGSAPTTAAIGADGAIIVELTTKLAWLLQSEADGDIDLDITLDDPGADTYYLVVVLPSGEHVVSGAITFVDDS